MPSHRTTVTLDEEALTFLSSQAGSNKSSYINDLLKQEKQRVLAEAIFKANQEEAKDLDYQHDMQEWDVTLSDGLSHEL
jgi:antitoxin CcdA